jgi:tetratricopeptide (TPR) repeat protein
MTTLPARVCAVASSIRAMGTGARAAAAPLRGFLPLLLVLLPVALLSPAHADRPSDRRESINTLLDALKKAPSEEVAAPIEAQIRQLWANAGTPAVTLLMSRGLRELKAGDNDQAIEDFGSAITLDPTMAEAYHQRAIARYHAGDTAGAITDLEAALRQEPRDFAALNTLSRIAEARENWKGAFDAWQKLLEIDPKTPGGEDRLKELRRKAFGEET